MRETDMEETELAQIARELRRRLDSGEPVENTRLWIRRQKKVWESRFDHSDRRQVGAPKKSLFDSPMQRRVPLCSASAHFMEVVGVDDGHVGTVRGRQGASIRLSRSVEPPTAST